jgi:hypothetical protein
MRVFNQTGDVLHGSDRDTKKKHDTNGVDKQPTEGVVESLTFAGLRPGLTCGGPTQISERRG